MTYFSIGKIIQLLLMYGINVSVFVFIVVLASINLRTFKQHYKIGLLMGTIVFFLLIPGLIFNLLYLDPTVLLSKIENSSTNNQFMTYCVYAGMFFGVLISIIQIGWHMIVYHVGATEWDKIRPNALPLLSKHKNIPWRQIMAGAAFGVIAGSLSHVIFLLFKIEAGDSLKQLLSMFPRAHEASPFLRIPIIAMTFTAAAITEELVFRGGLFAFLLRLSKNNRIAIISSIILVSLLWSLLHLANASMPLIKCLQIFVISIGLCEFARRSCLESAIAGHIALNLSALALSFNTL